MQVFQERDELPTRRLVIIGVAVLAFCGVCVSVSWGMYAPIHAPELGTTNEVPDEVNAVEMSLFATDAPGLEDIERAQQRLDSYGWVDRSRGVIHIPIEEAMRLHAESVQGREARDPAEPLARPPVRPALPPAEAEPAPPPPPMDDAPPREDAP